MLGQASKSEILAMKSLDDVGFARKIFATSPLLTYLEDSKWLIPSGKLT
jgi:hypothetical protein